MRKAMLTFIILLSLSLSVFTISCETEKEIGGVKGPSEEVGEVKEESEEIAGETKEEPKEMAEETGEMKEEAKETAGEEASKEMVVAEATGKGDPAKGKEKFTQICASCHGPEGKGDGPAGAALNPKPRNLSDAEYVSTLSNEHLFKTINGGGAAVGKSPLMPAWGGTLSEDDIWNVIAYIRKDICKCEYKGK